MVHTIVFSYIFHSVPAIVSPTSHTVKPTKSSDVFVSSNSGITNSTYIISSTNPISTVTLFTSGASYVTSSMTMKIAEDVTTNSVTNATEAHEHGNNESTAIPMILAIVFGSLLGLCIVVCIIGIILKKQKRKRQIRHGTFRLAAFNPLFNRYICHMFLV